MKQFTTLKVGYSKGIYGCSGEYFTTIVIDGEDTFSVSHHGLYGSEERVNAVLKDAGYKEFYVPTDYGLMKSREIPKWFLSEKEAIEELKSKIV